MFCGRFFTTCTASKNMARPGSPHYVHLHSEKFPRRKWLIFHTNSLHLHCEKFPRRKWLIAHTNSSLHLHSEKFPRWKRLMVHTNSSLHPHSEKFPRRKRLIVHTNSHHIFVPRNLLEISKAVGVRVHVRASVESQVILQLFSRRWTKAYIRAGSSIKPENPSDADVHAVFES